MKKRCALFLIAVLLLLPVLSLSSCEEKAKTGTFVGTIAYAKYYDASNGDPEYAVCKIFVSSLKKEDSEIWMPFRVHSLTTVGSGFTATPSTMPELAIGNTVEVVYKYYTSSPVMEFTAVSLKSIDPENATATDLPITPNKKYDIDKKENVGNYIKGTVIHVVKLDPDKDEYLLYLDDTDFASSLYLIFLVDARTKYLDGGEVLELLRSGEIGYRVDVLPTEPFPYNELGIRAVDRMQILK